MNTTETKAIDREAIEQRQREFAKLLEAYQEAQAVAMGYVAGMEAAMAKMAERK